MRDSFVFYRSFYEALKEMDKNVQADCLMALAQYALDGDMPGLTPEVRMFMTLAKPQIDANNQKFVNGSKGGRPKRINNQTETKTEPENNQEITEPKPNDNQTETKTEPKENQTETGIKQKEKNKNTPLNPQEEKNKNIITPVNNKLFTFPLPESGRDKTKEKSKKFNPPDYEDVLNYATERGRADLAKQFFDYFTVGNWKDSSGKAVISWKQKFVTWENHTPVKAPPKPPEMSAEEKRRQQELIDKIFGE